jgi:hypothetical protein
LLARNQDNVTECDLHVYPWVCSSPSHVKPTNLKLVFAVLSNKTKVWLARNQDNVSNCSVTSNTLTLCCLSEEVGWFDMAGARTNPRSTAPDAVSNKGTIWIQIQ